MICNTIVSLLLDVAVLWISSGCNSTRCRSIQPETSVYSRRLACLFRSNHCQCHHWTFTYCDCVSIQVEQLAYETRTTFNYCNSRFCLGRNTSIRHFRSQGLQLLQLSVSTQVETLVCETFASHNYCDSSCLFRSNHCCTKPSILSTAIALRVCSDRTTAYEIFATYSYCQPSCLFRSKR